MQTALSIAAAPKRQIKTTAKPTDDFGVVRQVKLAFSRQNRLATALGTAFGAFVPVATYVEAHLEAPAHPWYWLLVAGGLLYSATTVWQWGRMAFGNAAKATGFVLLVEGVMTFSHELPLSLAALTLLAAINAVATGCKLTVKK